MTPALPFCLHIVFRGTGVFDNQRRRPRFFFKMEYDFTSVVVKKSVVEKAMVAERLLRGFFFVVGRSAHNVTRFWKTDAPWCVCVCVCARARACRSWDATTMNSVWQERYNKKRERKFWYNPDTKETSWTDPTVQLQGSFVEKFDATHKRAYWVNVDTKESTWVRPPADKIVQAQALKRKATSTTEDASAAAGAGVVANAEVQEPALKKKAEEEDAVPPSGGGDSPSPTMSPRLSLHRPPPVAASSAAPVPRSPLHGARKEALLNFGQVGSYSTDREKSYAGTRLVHKQRRAALRSSADDYSDTLDISITREHYSDKVVDRSLMSEPQSPIEAPLERGPVGTNSKAIPGGSADNSEDARSARKRSPFADMLRVRQPVILTSRPAFSTLHQRRMAAAGSPKANDLVLDVAAADNPSVDERVRVVVGDKVILSPSVGGSGTVVLLDDAGEGAQVELGSGARVWVPCVETAMAPGGAVLVGHRVRVDDCLGVVQAYEDGVYVVALEDGGVVSSASVTSVPGQGELVATGYGRGTVLSVSESDSVVVDIPDVGVLPFEASAVLLANYALGDTVRVRRSQVGAVVRQDGDGLVVQLDGGAGEVHVAEAGDIELWSKAAAAASPPAASKEDDWVVVVTDAAAVATVEEAAMPPVEDDAAVSPVEDDAAVSPVEDHASAAKRVAEEETAPAAAVELSLDEEDAAFNPFDAETAAAEDASSASASEEEEDDDDDDDDDDEPAGEGAAEEESESASTGEDEDEEADDDAAAFEPMERGRENEHDDDIEPPVGAPPAFVEEEPDGHGEEAFHHDDDDDDEHGAVEEEEEPVPPSHDPFDEHLGDDGSEANEVARDPFDEHVHDEDVVVDDEEEERASEDDARDPFDEHVHDEDAEDVVVDDEEEEEERASEDDARDPFDEHAYEVEANVAAPPLASDPFSDEEPEEEPARDPFDEYAPAAAEGDDDDAIAPPVEPPPPDEAPASDPFDSIEQEELPTRQSRAAQLKARVEALNSSTSRALADMKTSRATRSLAEANVRPSERPSLLSASESGRPSVRELASKMNLVAVVAGGGGMGGHAMSSGGDGVAAASRASPPAVPRTRPLSFRKESQGDKAMENSAALSKPTIAAGRRRQPTRLAAAAIEAPDWEDVHD